MEELGDPIDIEELPVFQCPVGEFGKPPVFGPDTAPFIGLTFGDLPPLGE
jgi:hypothetical protein